MIVKLQNVRLAFPALFEPKDYMNDGKFRYRATFIMPKNHPNIADIEKAMLEVATAKWGAKAQANLMAIKSNHQKCCFFDGNAKADLNGFAGNMALNANNESRPVVVDRNKAALTAQDGKPYGGCYVNATIGLWAQDNQFGKAIRAELRTVTFLRDGDSFGGSAPITADEIDDVTDGADAGDLA